jgi:hypothetical protein
MARIGAPADGVFSVSTEVWVIAYDEVRSGTMIRTAQRKDQAAHGRFWIEPATGRVLMSELIVDNRAVGATIDVSFQSEPLLGILVPIEMCERYEGSTLLRVVLSLSKDEHRRGMNWKLGTPRRGSQWRWRS